MTPKTNLGRGEERTRTSVTRVLQGTGEGMAKANSPIDKVHALQRALYVAAKRNGQRKFPALYDRIARPDVMRRAWQQIRRNKGAAGIDGETLQAIEVYGVERIRLGGGQRGCGCPRPRPLVPLRPRRRLAAASAWGSSHARRGPSSSSQAASDVEVCDFRQACVVGAAPAGVSRTRWARPSPGSACQRVPGSPKRPARPLARSWRGVSDWGVRPAP